MKNDFARSLDKLNSPCDYQPRSIPSQPVIQTASKGLLKGASADKPARSSSGFMANLRGLLGRG